jgi:hypothetical protein
MLVRQRLTRWEHFSVRQYVFSSCLPLSNFGPYGVFRWRMSSTSIDGGSLTGIREFAPYVLAITNYSPLGGDPIAAVF